MKKIRFLGAAGEVTGSAFLLTSRDETKVLIDFGMFQGPREIADLNYQPLRFNPADLKAVLVTHAHLDHCGRLPLLVLGGFAGKIFMTAPTLALVEVVLRDAERIASEKIDQEPLYSVHEVEKILAMTEVVSYDQQFSIGGLDILFKDAGHILGSASIKVTDNIDKQTIIFSGDLGNTPEDIVRPTEYFDQADIVVMESTYGDAVHPVDNPSDILAEEINAIEKSGGVLLIPAFSIERTQEILHRMHHLKKDGKIRMDLPVFLDGRMGISATTIFKDFKEFYNQELQSHMNDPFMFSGLTITEEIRDSQDIVRAMDPKIIIAGSGMLTGGRILSHAKNYLPVATTRLLLVGYQGVETLGRRLLEGERKVWIDRKMIKVKASIREIKSFSAHADQPKLLTWLGHVKGVKKVFLIHGDPQKRQLFAQKVQEVFSLQDVFLPKDGEEFPLE